MLLYFIITYLDESKFFAFRYFFHPYKKTFLFFLSSKDQETRDIDAKEEKLKQFQRQ